MNAGKALDYVVKNHFIKSAGSRIEDDVPQHLVVILGDQSRDDVNRPATMITSTSIKPLGVGARNVDRDQLEIITNDPGRVLVVQDFIGLPALEKKVQSILEETVILTTESPGIVGPGKAAIHRVTELPRVEKIIESSYCPHTDKSLTKLYPRSLHLHYS